MTTIVYHQGILATDSKATRSFSKPFTFTCSHCHTETTSNKATEETQKIGVAMHHRTFRGEKIVAVAGAGKSNDINGAAWLLRAGHDLEQFYKAVHIFEADLMVDRNYTLVILTEKKGYLFQVRLSRTSYAAGVAKEFGLEESIYIGTGSSATQLAVEKLGFNAVEAIIAAAATDEHSSLPVQWVSIHNPDHRVHVQYMREVTDAREWLRENRRWKLPSEKINPVEIINATEVPKP